MRETAQRSMCCTGMHLATAVVVRTIERGPSSLPKAVQGVSSAGDFKSFEPMKRRAMGERGWLTSHHPPPCVLDLNIKIRALRLPF